MRVVVFMIVDVSSNDTFDTVVIIMKYCGEYSNIKKKKHLLIVLKVSIIDHGK